MKIGYARVSTDAQETNLQMDALRGAKCTRVYQEKASGAKAERPELMKLVDNARKGDVVIVWKLFDWMVTGGVLTVNPAAVVRGPSYVIKKGKTPVLTPDEARLLLDSIRARPSLL